ncbi:MAG: F0F1 ATP synthase subunit B [Lachnospiraceae bacterium]|nr:F0F1 ATP synthase subunit B [Lachnospiraceae bacterium]
MLLIKKFLFKPIREMLAKRQELADEKLRVAEADKTAAEELKATYEKNMEQARDKANELLASAQKTAASQSDEIIRAANEQAVAIKSKAEADIAQERRKAVNELKGEIGSMAMEIAGKVIEREISEKDHEKLIDEFIENVGKA